MYNAVSEDTIPMASTVDELLMAVALIDPEKAAHLRWVGPHLKEEGVIEAARKFLAANAVAARGGASNPRETLLDLDERFDPDEPTGLFEAYEEGALQDEPTAQGGGR